MTADGSLEDLLWRLSSPEDEARIVGAEDLERWSEAMVAELERLGLLAEHTPANRATCPACELGHTEDVEFIRDAHNRLRAVIRCPVFGRTEIEAEALRQWKLRDDALTNYLQREDDRSGLSGVVAWDGTTLTVDRDRVCETALHQTATPQSEADAYLFRRNGDGWLLAFGGKPFYLGDSKGMEHIHRLLRQPNEWLFLADMMSVVECGLEMVDQKTLRELRRLSADGDATRSQLKAFLGSVTRIDGSARLATGAMTRSVNATRNSIDRGIRRIRNNDAALADHLDRSIRKGIALSYQTELEIAWET